MVGDRRLVRFPGDSQQGMVEDELDWHLGTRQAGGELPKSEAKSRSDH